MLKLPKWMHWWEKPYAVMRERQNKIWLRYWNEMKAKIEKGMAPECFGRQFVEAGYSKKGIDELQAAFVAGSECGPALPFVYFIQANFLSSSIPTKFFCEEEY